MAGPGVAQRTDARRVDPAARPIDPAARPKASEQVSEPVAIKWLSLADIASVSTIIMAVIAVLAVLYLGRIFFLPIVTGFIIGTMLSPAASFLVSRGLPRSISAVLIVIGVFAGLAFIVGLISMPLMDWSSRLPEITAALKAKAELLKRPLQLWHQLQEFVGEAPALTPGLHLPKIEWMQYATEYLSPTLAEIILFFATLVLFLASWPDMRRATVMMMAEREARLRTLRIVNAIEHQLGSYLLMVTGINVGVGIATGLICAATGMPNAASLGALAATLNYIPILGPIAMFVVIAVVGLINFPAIGAALLPCALFAGMIFIEGHFVTPTIIGRRLSLNALAIFLAIGFWTWLWGPMGAFLSSPILIVCLVLKEHLMTAETGQLPEK